jgi:small subunit ribosomal protein S6
MKNYEVTFIVDPVLSGDEIKTAAQMYEDLLKNEKATIVQTEEMGLKQLAYPINKRSSGIYFCIEFSSDASDIIPKLELALRRDERIMRFLSIHLDKYGIKYNQDKRDGKIGKAKKASDKKSDKKTDRRGSDRRRDDRRRDDKKAAPSKSPAVEVKKPVAPSTEEE